MLNLNLNILGAGGASRIGAGANILPTTTTSTTSTTSTTTTSTTTTSTTTSTTTTVAPTAVEYLVVAGGGGGRRKQQPQDPTSSGGAGGLLSGSLNVFSGAYDIVVGAGGPGGVEYSDQGKDGNNSLIQRGGSVLIQSIYGGGTCHPGGSGAGAQYGACGGQAGTPGQGNQGGPSSGTGGGAGSTGDAGGLGAMWVDGVTYARGGGGAGGGYLANSGNGGAGGTASGNYGQDGSSGVVIIRYAGTPNATGGVISQSGGYTYHNFNSSGTFTWN
jgi:hypothetical protein